MGRASASGFDVVEIGVILVNQVLHPVFKLFLEFRRPHILRPFVSWIVAVPRHTVEIRKRRILAIIRYSRQRPCLVGPMRRLKPPVGSCDAGGHAKMQALFHGGGLPHPHHILAGRNHGIEPGLVFRIPHIEIVMVNRDRDHVTGAGLLVEFDQPVRLGLVELGRREELDKVFVARFGRMSVRGAMIVVGGVALLIHPSGIPAGYHAGDAFRSPMHKDPELAILKPFGRLIPLE